MFGRSLTTRPVIALVGVESLSAYIIAYEIHVFVREYCIVMPSSLLHISAFRKVMLPLFYVGSFIMLVGVKYQM